MGSGGTEWESNDNFDYIRMNKKTRFVGSATQIANLITSPQIGQMAYCTVTSSPHTKDKMSYYNSSSAWVVPRVTESSEGSFGGNATGGSAIVSKKAYTFTTLPTDYKFYLITRMTVLVGGSAGEGKLGVDLVNANPPTVAATQQMAVTPRFTMTGSADESKTAPAVISKPIRGGSIVGAWCWTDTAGVLNGNGSSSYYKTYASEPNAFTESVAWSTSGALNRVTAYYRGYN